MFIGMAIAKPLQIGPVPKTKELFHIICLGCAQIFTQIDRSGRQGLIKFITSVNWVNKYMDLYIWFLHDTWKGHCTHSIQKLTI